MELDGQPSPSPFKPTSQPSGSHHTSPVIQLLNRGDQLTQRFQRQFNDSITHVQALSSAHQQYVNLSNLPDRSALSPARSQHPSIRERTLATLAKTGEDALASIRGSLTELEATVDQLSELLYKVDIYLAEPVVDGSIGFDPVNALNHLSSLFSAYQAELLAKRELFSSFNCEEIDVNAFAQQWKICDEIKALTQETMDDLADVMGAWAT